MLFAQSGGAWILSARGAAGTTPSRAPGVLWFAPVAVYGGYFGAGMSVMLLALLSVSRAEDFRATNVLKNLLSALTSFVAVVVFLVQGIVAWPSTLVVMAGASVGGFLGGRLVRVLPAPAVRWIVIAAGSALTLVYAWRYWLP